MKGLAVGAAMLAAVLIGEAADAQVLHTLESPSPQANGQFGVSVSGVGDVNADGYHDFVVGAWREDGGAYHAGRAYVFSGPTGIPLYALQSPNAEDGGLFGRSVSGVEDVNNDGYADIAVGAQFENVLPTSGAGRAYVFGGPTGILLRTLEPPSPQSNGQFGFSVSGAGDANNDGYDDVVVGALWEDGGASHAGQAYIFSGQTGGVLDTLQSPNPEVDGRFGFSVSGVGDVNDDGCGDVVVGAHCEDGGHTEAGRAYVLSGQTGDPILILQSPNAEAGGRFGYSVSGAGDVNSDGWGDIVVGALKEDGGVTDAGRVYIFDGQAGGLLHALQSPGPKPDGYFGHSVSAAGDVDSDGYDDVIVGGSSEDGGATAAGRAYIFSGLTGGLLWTLESPNPEAYGHFGCSVSGVGDVNGAGYDDVVVGAFYEDGGATDAGRAYVFAPADVAIELASFTGEPWETGVRLVWVTLTEKDNLGFNVDRAPARTDAFVRLNVQIIPGAGTSTVPHSYDYRDRSVQPGATYWYRLEDVSLDGEGRHHGPIPVAVPDRPELSLRVVGGSDPTFLLTFARLGRASLRLYDVGGRLVATLWEGEVQAGGSTSVRPQPRRELPTGLYTASLCQAGRTIRHPVVITR